MYTFPTGLTVFPGQNQGTGKAQSYTGINFESFSARTASSPCNSSAVFRDNFSALSDAIGKSGWLELDSIQVDGSVIELPTVMYASRLILSQISSSGYKNQ